MGWFYDNDPNDPEGNEKRRLIGYLVLALFVIVILFCCGNFFFPSYDGG